MSGAVSLTIYSCRSIYSGSVQRAVRLASCCCVRVGDSLVLVAPVSGTISYQYLPHQPKLLHVTGAVFVLIFVNAFPCTILVYIKVIFLYYNQVD